MFKEHRFVIWGTRCQCGCECGILQNQHHPWINTEFIVKLICPACGREVSIDKNSAETFYNKKIYSYFNDLYGTVVDFGCGDSFLSRYLIRQKCHMKKARMLL